MLSDSISPEVFPVSVEVWLTNFLRKNKWRVARYIDMEDLLQESRMKWYQCYNKYHDRDDVDDSHFVNLFRTSIRNLLNDIAREYQLKEECLDSDIVYRIADNQGDSCVSADIELLLKTAPEDIRFIIEYLISNPEVLPKRKWRGSRGRLRCRERLREYLMRIKGVDVGENPIRRVREYLMS